MTKPMRRKARKTPLLQPMALAALLALGVSPAHTATRTWVPGQTFWDLVASWDTGLPGTLDDVVLGSNATIFRLNTVNIRSFTGTGQLQLTGGQLGISAASSIGTLFLNGGVLTGNTTVAAGAYTWNAGNLGVYQQNTQLLVNVAGTATLDGVGSKFILGGSVLTLNGASSWASGASILYLQGIGASSTAASRLVIGNGGTFDDKGNGAGDRSIATYAYSGASVDIASGGTYTKSAGTGKTTVSVLFNNSGTTNVNAGTLSLTAGGASSGSFSILAGSTLGFDGGTHTISAALTNAGTLQNNGGTTTLSGTYSGSGAITVGSGSLTVAANIAPGTLNLNGGSFISNATTTAGATTFAGGTATGSGTVNATTLVLNAGSFGTYQQDTKTKFNVSGTATLDGANTKFIYGGATLTLNGASAWAAGSGPIYLQGVGAASTQGSKLVIGNGGSFDDQGNGSGDRSIAVYAYNGASVDIASGGSYTKSAGTGKTTVGVAFNNSGATTAAAGILSLTNGGTSSGSFAVQSGATLGFDGGAHTVSGAVTNAGTLQSLGGTANLNGTYSGSGGISVGGGTLTVTANAAPTTLNLGSGTYATSGTTTAGTTTFTGGTASGSGTINTTTLALNAGSFGTYQQDTKTKFNVSGAATLDGANSKFILGGATLALNGASTWNSGASTIYLQGAGASSTAASKLAIGSSGTFDDKGNNTANRSISNYAYGGASFDNAGSYTKSAGTGTTSIDVLFNNTGTLLVQAGAVNMSVGGTSAGTFQSAAAGAVNFTGGTHNLNGATLTNDGLMNISNGTVKVSGTSTYGGAGTLNVNGGTLDVAGTLGPAAAMGLSASGVVTGVGTLNAGSFSWASGSVGTYQQDTKLTLNIAGSLALDATNAKYILGGATVNLNGGAVWAAGTSSLNLQGIGASSTAASTLVVTNGQTFDDKGNGAGNHAINSYGYNGGQFNVASGGTYLKSAGTGVTTVSGPVFNNAGTTNVQAGKLSILSGGAASGTFQTGASGVVSFDGGTYNLTGATFDNAGQINVTGGIVNLIGSITYAGSGALSVTGGALNVKGTLGPAASVLLGSGGTISDGGTVNAGTFTWNGGTFGVYPQDTQTKFNVAGTATLDGGSTKAIVGGATVTLNGASTWNAGGAGIQVQGVAGSSVVASRLVIGGGGTFDDKGNGANNRSISNYAGTGALVSNAGSYTKSGGSGTTSIDILFNNSGTVESQSGTLSLNGGGTSTGTFKASSTGTLAFGGGTHTLTGASFDNASSVAVTNGTVNLIGATSYTGSGTLSVTGGVLNVSGTLGPAANLLLSSSGTISGPGTVNAGTFTWNGGAFGAYPQDTQTKFNVAGTATLDGASTKSIQGGATVTLNGASTWNAGGAGIQVQGVAGSSAVASRLVIGNGGTFDDKGNGANNRSISNYAGTGALVSNAGSYTKSGGSGTTSIDILFNNTGTVNVQAGVLSLTGGGTSSGSFVTGLGASTNLGSGYTLTHGSLFSGAGELAIVGNVNVTGTVSNNGAAVLALRSSGVLTGSATSVVNTDALNWTGGNVGVYPADTQIKLNVSGLATLDGANTKNILGGATVTLNGASTWNAGGASIQLQGIGGSSTVGSRIVVATGASFDDKGNGAGNRSISSYSYSGASFNVAGAYTKSGGTGITYAQTVLFNNTGTVNTQVGTLQLDGGGTSSGSFAASAGAATNLGGGYVLGNGTSFSGAGELGITGTVTASGTTSNNGAAVFALRSSGVLTGSATGIVNTDAFNWTGGQLGTYAVDTQNKLNVSGTATLDGANTKYVMGGATMTLGGASTWQAGSAGIQLQGIGGSSTVGSRIVVATGATFDDKGNGAGNRSISSYSFNGASFNVAGTYTKSGGTGITYAQTVLFNNTGTVNTQVGTLQLDGGGTSSGSFAASAGAATNLGGGYVLGNGTSFSGAGELGITGTVTASGTTSNNGAAVLALRSSGVLTGSATGIVNTDAFNWTGGQLGTYAVDTQNKLNVSGTATLDGANTKYVVGGATMTLGGASTWQAGSAGIQLQGIGAGSTVGSRIVVATGATFDDKGNGSGNRSISSYAYNGASINLAGIYTKSGGTGITSVSSVLFNNAGTVNTQIGTLQLDGGGTSSGLFTASANAVTNLGTGYVLGNGTTFGGAGELGITGTVTASGTTSNSGAAVFAIRNNGILTGSATGIVNTDAFSWTGGQLGTYAVDTPNKLNVAGVATLNGSNAMYVLGGATLALNGASTWQQGSSSLNLQGVGASSTSASKLIIGSGGTFTDQGNGAGGRSITSYGYNGGVITNNGTWQKTAGTGQTTVGSTVFTNTGTVKVSAGRFSLQGGFTNFSGSTLTGGSYTVTGPAATFSFTGANIVTNAAAIVLDAAGSAILNDSTSGDALASFATNAATGSFTIRNGRNFTTAGAFGNAGVVNIGPSSTFTATGAFTDQASGQIQMAGGNLAGAAITNAGQISGFGNVANTVGNTGSVLASGGTLSFAAGVQGSSGSVTVGLGSTLALGAASTARTLTNNGTLLNLGGNNITVALDYDNASFGVGNAFNRRAATSGSGLILAAGTTQQTLSGALVQNGATGSATLALPTVRVGLGALTTSFTVNDVGSGGASLRGALQTTGINNAGLSGSGVTAQNFGPIAQGTSSSAYTVSFDPTFGQALSGQSIQVVNNFDNVAGQTLAITGKAYNLAAASPATPSPVVFAKQRVGGTLSQALTLTNTAAASGYSESLNASISASGTATAAGAFSLLAAGATNSTSLVVGLDTSSAGAQGGVATITLASDGTGTSGFAPLALTAQTVNVSGDVYRLAAASTVTPSPVVLANQRVGGTLSQPLTFSNLAAVDGYSEALNATIAANGTATAAGAFSLLAAGATSTALSVGVNTGSAGAKSGVATITLASDGTGSSGFAPLALAPQTVNVSGNVYRLASASAVTPSPVVLANQRVGGTLSQALTFSNLAAVDGYAEALNATIAANGGATAAGAFSLLAAGATSTALSVGVNTGSAGAKSGVATITLASDGTGSSGFAPLALAPQTVNVSGNVYRLASASAVTPSPVVLANQRVGGTLSQALSFSNLAAADGYAEALNATIAANGSATAAGAFSLLAAGATSTALSVGVNTGNAGAKSGVATIALASDGTGSSGFAPLALAPQTVNVSGNVYRLAVPLVDVTPVVLAARVGDAAPSRSIAVTNNAPDLYTERLNASLSGAPSGFSTAGTVTGLVANTSSNALGVSLSTATAGSFSGPVAVTLVSSGAGTTLAPDQALASASVSLTGRVYAPAVAQLASTTVDFGTVRVGDTVAARTVGVTNAASGALNDTLRASLGSASAPFTTAGTVAGLAAGSSNNSGLSVQLSTAAAGVYAGAALVTFTSQNADLADLALATAGLSLQAQVNNLADPALAKSGGAGSFSHTALSYRLDFGTLVQGAGTATATLSLANTAGGPADALAGSWDLSSLPPGDAYSLSGFGSFSGLAAGAALNSLSVSFDSSVVGSYSRVVTLHGVSTNGSGPDLALADLTLRLEGNVAAVPEPGSYLLFAGGLVVLGWARRRQAAFRQPAA